MNIFLVDDDEIIRMGMKKIVEKSELDCTVVGEATDGCMALEKMALIKEIDLLITDIRMPVMDGLELIKRVSKQNPFIKIIVLSGFDDFSYVRDAFMDGAVDYLLKPVDKKEFISLLQKIEISIKKERDEQNYQKANYNLIVGNTLTKLFHGNYDGEVELQLKSLNISLESYFCVIITRIDDYYKNKIDRKTYDNNLMNLLEVMKKNVEETNEYSACQYIDKLETVTIIVSAKQFNKDKLSEELYGKLSSANEEEITYTMGVGDLHSGTKSAKTAYQEATEAANIRFYLGKGNRILYHEMKDKCIEMDYDMEDKAAMLVHFLELCDYSNAKGIMDNIFVDLSYVKPHMFRNYMLKMLDVLILRVKDFQPALLAYEPEYKDALQYINTYNELHSYMNSILQKAVEYIGSEHEKRSKKRIELAKQYIHKHYKENITLNDVAEHVELNPSYFSNFFKTEMGINFSEYLLDTRINTAKTLLKDPKIKVYEIGSMVGYEDAVSFGRAFKKKIGMSPKEYRNMVY